MSHISGHPWSCPHVCDKKTDDSYKLDKKRILSRFNDWRKTLLVMCTNLDDFWFWEMCVFFQKIHYVWWSREWMWLRDHGNLQNPWFWRFSWLQRLAVYYYRNFELKCKRWLLASRPKWGVFDPTSRPYSGHPHKPLQDLLNAWNTSCFSEYFRKHDLCLVGVVFLKMSGIRMH